MNTNAKKKVYVAPNIEVCKIEMLSMLASSGIDPTKDRFGFEQSEYMNAEDWSGESDNHSSETMNHEDWSYDW